MAGPQWTIMLYLSGDNDLSAEMVRAIDDIAEVGVPEGVAVTIQYDPVAPNLPTFRYFLQPGDKPRLKPHAGPIPLAYNAEPVPNAENAASPRTLSDFITWSLGKSSGKYRMLVLSGHGAGATGDFLTDTNVPGGQARSLSIPRLRDALTNARDAAVDHDVISRDAPLLHILGMDSCLMSMAEVGYEVRNATRQGADGKRIRPTSETSEYDPGAALVQYLVGSEGFVPNAGWPYGYLLEKLKEKVADGHDLDPKSVGGYIVRDFVDYYRNYVAAGVSVDMAACELARLDGLAVALDGLTNELSTAMKDPKIRDMVILAHWRAQSFKLDQNTDLGDFCDLLMKDAASGGYTMIEKACGRVTTAIAEALGKSDDRRTIRQDFVGVDFQYASGLSVYFPWHLAAVAPEYSKNGQSRFPELAPYRTLRFPKNTGWATLLEEYLACTMRPPKDLGGPTVEAVLAAKSGTPMGAPGGGLVVAGANKFVEGTNKFVEGTNKFVEGTNKFLQQLGPLLPWSMKNPPQQVEMPRVVEHQGPAQSLPSSR
jgi:Clostripain family